MGFFSIGHHSKSNVSIDTQRHDTSSVASSFSSASPTASSPSTSAFGINSFRNSGSDQIRRSWSSSSESSPNLQKLKKNSLELLSKAFKFDPTHFAPSLMSIVPPGHLLNPDGQFDQTGRMRQDAMRGSGPIVDVVKALESFLEMESHAWQTGTPLSANMQEKVDKARALLHTPIQINHSGESVLFREFARADAYDNQNGALRKGWEQPTVDVMSHHLRQIGEFAKEYKDYRGIGARLKRSMQSGSDLRMLQKSMRTNSAPGRLQGNPLTSPSTNSLSSLSSDPFGWQNFTTEPEPMHHDASGLSAQHGLVSATTSGPGWDQYANSPDYAQGARMSSSSLDRRAMSAGYGEAEMPANTGFVSTRQPSPQSVHQQAYQEPVYSSASNNAGVMSEGVSNSFGREAVHSSVNGVQSFGLAGTSELSDGAKTLQDNMKEWIKWTNGGQQKIDFSIYLQFEDAVERLPDAEKKVLEHTLSALLKHTPD